VSGRPAPVAAVVLLVLGVLVVAGASVTALRTRDLRTRLHAVTALTSVASPLIGAAVALGSGSVSAALQIALAVVVLAGTGPVLGAATGRLLETEDPR